MQPNLDCYSLDGPTIALPVPRPHGPAFSKTRSSSPASLAGELERARTSAASSSVGERLAWLGMALSAFAALGLSFWF